MTSTSTCQLRFRNHKKFINRYRGYQFNARCYLRKEAANMRLPRRGYGFCKLSRNAKTNQ